MKKPVFENKCHLCGKPQTPTLTDDGYKQYKCGEKCSCGGEFMLYLRGERIGDPKEATQ